MKNLFYLFSEKCFVFSKKFTFSVIVLILFITQLSCNTTEPPPPDDKKPTLTIAIDDTSCTEAWLQLITKDLILPAELTLKQYNPTGDSVTQIFSLSTQDSLLYIDSLLPNQTYNFQLSCIWNPASGNQYQVSSIKYPVKTMDTTSHNFTFQSWTFGTIGSSVLYDVAIINENNIWAVGEIMIADTSQNGYTTYNVVHWDGSQWELKRIPYTYNGQTFYNGIRAIFAFNENDIWFGIASLIHWNGTVYQSISTATFFPALVNKMWGTSSNDFYIVGTNGQIAHYNGTNWQRIESGTTLDFYDIKGSLNQKTSDYDIYTIAAKRFINFEKQLFQIKNKIEIEELLVEGIPYSIHSLWFKPNSNIYVVGSGIYKNDLIQSLQVWYPIHFNISNYYLQSIDGNNFNDLMISGDFGELLHFNGTSWKSFQSISPGYVLFQVRMRSELVVAVGTDGVNSYIIKGVR